MITTISKPYRRTLRQFRGGSYSEGGRWRYILHEKYAQSPEHYIRAFSILQKDLQELFDYVEPADSNLECYSFRINEILTRSCVEIESNFKAIFIENGNIPPKKQFWDITDYYKINETHRLSSYSVKIPYWSGDKNIRKPFQPWENDEPLDWYKSYNATKHNRHENFKKATLGNALEAICGLVIVLSAQFYNHDFSPRDWGLSAGGHSDGMNEAIGGYFRVGFPDDFPMPLRYEFNWQEMENLEDPFQNFDYKLTKK